MNNNKTRQAWVVLVLLTLFLGLTLSTSSLASTTLAQDTTDSQYFPQTQHSVSGKFLAYWKANGGLAHFGYPLTDAQNETDPETGKPFLTQWFERSRFELHPENTGTAYEVEQGLLGRELNREALGR